MLEMHLRQSKFTYSAWGPFTKSKERIQKFKETGDSRYIYQNKLDKTPFQQKRLMVIFNICQEEQLLKDP